MASVGTFFRFNVPQSQQIQRRNDEKRLAREWFAGADPENFSYRGGVECMYVTPRRSDMRSDYVIVLLTQQLLSRRSDLTFSVFGLVIWLYSFRAA